MLIVAVVLGAAAMNEAVGATRVVLKVKAASLADPGPDVRDAAFLAATDLTGRRPGQQCYELLDPEVPGDTVGIPQQHYFNHRLRSNFTYDGCCNKGWEQWFE